MLAIYAYSLHLRFSDAIILNNLASDVVILPPDQLSRQAMLCHRVLKTVQHSATSSSIITDQTWTCLLRFLLAINDVLLSPPAEKGYFIWKLEM